MIGHILLFAITARPEIPARLSLSEAIEMSLKSSPALQKAAAQVQQSEAQAAQFRSQRLPQFNVTAADTGQTVNLRALGITTSLLPAKAGPFQTVDARANITQPVLDIALLDRDHAAKEHIKVSRYLALNVRELLSFQVAVAFAQALRTQSAVSTLEQQLTLARKLQSITQDRLDRGVSSKLDLKRSEIQVQNLEQGMLETQNDLTAAKLHLADLLHAKPSTEFILTETKREDPPPTAATRSDYRAAESAVRTAELRLAAARHQRYPTGAFRANYGQSGPAWNENLNTFLIQGALNIPVYTGGRIESEIAEAQGKLAEAKADLEELRSQIETETLAARAARDSAQRQGEVARRTVELAKEELDLSTDRFTEGVADNTEVVNAQERLTRAEDNVLKAAFNLDLAQAQLKRALGVNQ
jgi:outer membrane protein TolC